MKIYIRKRDFKELSNYDDIENLRSKPSVVEQRRIQAAHNHLDDRKKTPRHVLRALNDHFDSVPHGEEFDNKHWEKTASILSKSSFWSKAKKQDRNLAAVILHARLLKERGIYDPRKKMH